MGVLGELFPGPKIRDEAGESGDGEQWRLGPIDLDNNTVQLHRAPVAEPEPAVDEDTAAPDA
ncbi:hypothetical protein [Pseudonocardia sp. H11422]|uniref:hypothetical protein n=1 Tax=Pseudonocardia sp. H11422 TaxID=2835866 RepID=UPI001BDD0B5B|nr:hypothetical protein [Pseudonocardia sp. H11422]